MHKLRQHQLNAKNALATANRGIICLPTGTGKTLVQSRALVDEITNNDPKVYVILSPRILLSNQLLHEVKQDLIRNHIDCHYLVVHSGQIGDDYSILEKELNLPSRDMISTTTSACIREEYNKSKRENVSLVISGTYHSASRIADAGIPVEILFCDEAHYLVQENLSWIVSKPFPSERTYHFTATLRGTHSAEGMGMNNRNLFGPILYQKKPVELIQAGEMVRPRIHMVDMSHDPEKDEGDGLAVAKAFEQHSFLINGGAELLAVSKDSSIHVNDLANYPNIKELMDRSDIKIGAKLLVVSKDGSTHLNNLANHPKIKELMEVRPNLTVYDISSANGARINGDEVTRENFLRRLRTMENHEEAIIIHHDILSEGIDVPGITGVMPMNSLKKAKFLQTLGRATRLHKQDRERLYSLNILPNELHRFVKPYAWLIIPVYGEIGEDLRDDMKEMIRELRDHGFDPSEDIVVRQKRGKKQQFVPIEMVTEPTRAATGLLEFSADVMHELEEEDLVNDLKLETIEMMSKTEDEFWTDLLGE